MFRAKQSNALVKAFIVMVIMGFLAKSGMDLSRARFDVEARSKRGPRSIPSMQTSANSNAIGEFGGNLDLLRERYEGPKTTEESNHYFDIWDENPSLPTLARVNGLTNNHALFIDSHGKAGLPRRGGGSGYGLYPGQRLTPSGSKTSYFSPRDFATVLGPDASANIHNVVIAGCNAEGRLRSAEFRAAFPNATNVTYMTPGEAAFKPMYYQAIVLPSSEIRILYGRPLPQSKSERYECQLQRAPSLDAHPLGLYIADLYLPGASKPYRTTRAGRELLDPPALRCASRPALTSSKAPPNTHEQDCSWDD